MEYPNLGLLKAMMGPEGKLTIHGKNEDIRKREKSMAVPIGPDGNQIANLGDRVWYTLSAEDAAAITQSRSDWESWRNAGNSGNDPWVSFKGNDVSAGSIYAADVVSIQGTGTVNLVVKLDATDIFWATGRSLGADSSEQGAYTFVQSL